MFNDMSLRTRLMLMTLAAIFLPLYRECIYAGVRVIIFMILKKNIC